MLWNSGSIKQSFSRSSRSRNIISVSLFALTNSVVGMYRESCFRGFSQSRDPCNQLPHAQWRTAGYTSAQEHKTHGTVRNKLRWSYMGFQ